MTPRARATSSGAASVDHDVGEIGEPGHVGERLRCGFQRPKQRLEMLAWDRREAGSVGGERSLRIRGAEVLEPRQEVSRELIDS